MSHRISSRKRSLRHNSGIRLGLVILGFCVLLVEAAIAQDSADDAPPKETLDIGVLATTGATRAMESWGPTIDYLNLSAEEAEIAVQFRLRPQTTGSLQQAGALGELDLILSDPAQFVAAEVEWRARAVLGLAEMWEGQSLDLTGATIFARRSDSARRIPDLADSKIMAVDRNGFSGWWLAEQEFRKHRITAEELTPNVVFSGGNGREVVYAVRSGLVRAGIVQAGLLERLIAQGVIAEDEFVTISPLSHDGYPFNVSTPLYPHWVLSAMPQVSEDVLALVINSLLALPPNSAEAQAAGGRVWQAPQNYQIVHELLISLRVRPYTQYMRQAATRIYRAYRLPIWLFAILSLGSIALLSHQLRESRRLAEERKNVLQSEVRANRFYRNAIEEHTVFAMLNKDGLITHANKRFANLIGRRRSDVVHRQLISLLPEEDRDAVLSEIIASMDAGAPWQGALRMLQEDGNPSWVQCTLVPVTGSAENPSEIALVASDVTKTRAGVSEERFQDTLELVQDQVVVLRPGKLEVLHANQAAERMLISDRMGGDWRNKPVKNFITKDDYQMLKLRVEAIETGPQRRVVWEAEAQSGITYEISLEYCKPEGDEARIVAMYRDITQRKIAEKAKNEFIATISHELRTPLTSMKGALGLAASGAAGEMSEKVGKLVNLASTNCERLNLLINDILDLEKIESGKMSFNMEPCDLGQLVGEALEANEHYANQFGVSFTGTFSDEPGMFMTLGDRGRLRQVLDNLMSNAAKFSPKGSEILISVSAYKNRMRISVRDYGCGIPAKAQATIFDKFTQADSSDTRAKGGTGLGLAIARQIVEHHSGRLFFVSEEGAGTEFFVDLPILEGETVVAVPVGQDGGMDEPATFSEDPTEEPLLAPIEDAAPFFRKLVERASAKGDLGATEMGLITSVQIAKGRGVVSQSDVFKWIGRPERELLVELQDASLLRNRPVALVEFTYNDLANKPDPDASREFVSLVSDWLNETVETAEQPQFVVMSPDAEVRTALGEAKITALADLAQVQQFVAEDAQDYLLMAVETNGARAAIVFPLEGGALPASTPLTLLVARQAEAQAEQGVVSKFSSIEGGGRGRARRRGQQRKIGN